MNIGTRSYEGFGGPADISVDALTSIEEEREFWEKRCKKLEKEARSERLEHLEDIQRIRDFLPGVTTWNQLIAGIEAMQMRIEQLEEADYPAYSETTLLQRPFTSKMSGARYQNPD